MINGNLNNLGKHIFSVKKERKKWNKTWKKWPQTGQNFLSLWDFQN